MADLVVIVPSRGRPRNAHELVKAFDDTCSGGTEIIFAIDERDVAGIYDYPFGNRATTVHSPSANMGEALAMTVAAVLRSDPEYFGHGFEMPFAIGFMGDDHRPRTVGWDKAYVEALRELGSGIVYGNDLLQGERLPTQVAMTSDIIRALGYMAPPSLVHLYFDNFWLDLGKAAGCIRYLPDVVVEHRHPIAGKAKWDEGYRRVNNSAMYERDEAAYLKYRAEQFDTDVATVRTLRGGA